jgi:hypothetical protein
MKKIIGVASSVLIAVIVGTTVAPTTVALADVTTVTKQQAQTLPDTALFEKAAPYISFDGRYYSFDLARQKESGLSAISLNEVLTKIETMNQANAKLPASSFTATDPNVTNFSDASTYAETGGTDPNNPVLVSSNYNADSENQDLAKPNRSAAQIWADLPTEQKNNWEIFFAENNISSADQLTWLQYADANQSQPRWKVWLIKQTLNFAAKQAGKSASGVLVEKWARKVSGTNAQVQKTISDFVVSLGVSRSTANIIAKGAMFLIG